VRGGKKRKGKKKEKGKKGKVPKATRTGRWVKGNKKVGAEKAEKKDNPVRKEKVDTIRVRQSLEK